MGLTIVCALILLGLALRGVPTEEFSYGPHLLVLLAVAIFILASLAVTEIIPWRSQSMHEWARPKVLGSFIALIMGAVGLAAGLVPIFNPPAATEQTVNDVRKRLEDAGITRGEASLVEQHINGLWGEPGCLVTYDLLLNNGLLTITSKKSVAGQATFKMDLQAERGQGPRLVASVIEPRVLRGDQHEFVFEQAGTQEFLIWVMKKRETSLKLDRCTGPGPGPGSGS